MAVRRRRKYGVARPSGNDIRNSMPGIEPVDLAAITLIAATFRDIAIRYDNRVIVVRDGRVRRIT